MERPNRFRHPLKRAVPFVLAALLWSALVVALDAQERGAAPMPDAKKVMGPDRCGECHKAEIMVWRKSAHAVGFSEMHRSDEAQRLSEKLGIRRIKRDPQCVGCHYTEIVDDGAARARFGVSCESCHGVARDWIKIHDDYGGKDVTKESEPPAHRKERIARSIQNGMHHPGRIYDLAAQCYGCHVVADPALVEKGGHSAGSAMELVAWTQGEVRHNFVASEGKHNDEAPIERRRVFYVLGWALDLEYGLRAAARASSEGPYLQATKARVARALERLRQIDEALGGSEPVRAVTAAGGIEIASGKGEALSAASQKVAAAARAFSESIGGDQLAALDRLLPERHQYKGEVRETP